MATEGSISSRPILTNQQRQRLAECFKRGRHLASVEQDHDYAHAMFAECVGQDPANLEYVEALIANLKAKFENNKKRAAHIFRLSGEREFKKALTENAWPQVLQLGLDVLKADPWHVPTLRGMAQACQALHYNEVELVYLKQALDAAPRNADVNRHCARSLARMGQFDQAIACWHRVEEINRNDREAAQMISRLAEERLRAAVTGEGRPSKGSDGQRDKAADSRSDKEEQPSQDVMAGSRHLMADSLPLSPRQRLERAIEEDPADVANYLKLAELLCESGYYDKAERTLIQAQRKCAQVGLVEDALKRVRTERMQAERDAAEIERQKKLRAERKKFRMPWLELTLITAGVALVFQMMPSWWQAVSGTLVEHTQLLLILANIVALILLVLWRQWKT